MLSKSVLVTKHEPATCLVLRRACVTRQFHHLGSPTLRLEVWPGDQILLGSKINFVPSTEWTTATNPKTVTSTRRQELSKETLKASNQSAARRSAGTSRYLSWAKKTHSFRSTRTVATAQTRTSRKSSSIHSETRKKRTEKKLARYQK